MLTAGVAASSPRFCAMSNLQSPPLLASSGASFLSPLLGLGFHSLKFNSIIARKTKPLSIRAAKTESKGVSLGFRAPDFQLLEPLTGKIWTLQDFEVYPALLVMFICNHCPFVIHLKKDFVKLSNFYMKKGLAVVAISSNSVATHPQDGPEFMAEDAKVYGYPFPYLYDEGEVSVLPLCIATLGSDNIKPNLVDVRGSVARVADQADLDESQDIARDFEAVCTPEFFLFKKDGRRPFELVYHGQFDDSRPSNNVAITGRDLSMAIDSVLSGQPVNPVQKPSVGCSIKWHPEVKQ